MDAPYCSECLKKGLLNHTTKVLRVPFYRCQECKIMTNIAEYPQEALLWKTDPETWKAYINTKKEEVNVTS